MPYPLRPRVTPKFRLALMAVGDNPQRRKVPKFLPRWWWIVPKYRLARMAGGNESGTLSVSLELRRTPGFGGFVA